MNQENGYLVPDRQGCTVGVVSNAGAKVVSYAYDPYGNIRSASGLGTRLAWGNTITYAGARRDQQCSNTDPTGGCNAAHYVVAGGGVIIGSTGVLGGALAAPAGAGWLGVVGGYAVITAGAASLGTC